MLHYLRKAAATKKKDMKRKNGIVGENTLWDGPLSQEGRPHGKGSSSGSKGMKLKVMQPCGCIGDCGCAGLQGPITQRAKG